MKQVMRGDRHNGKRDESAGAEEWGTGTVKGTLNSQVCVCAVCSHVIYCPVLYVNIYNGVSVWRLFTNGRSPFLGGSSSSSSPPLPPFAAEESEENFACHFFFYYDFLKFLFGILNGCFASYVPTHNLANCASYQPSNEIWLLGVCFLMVI